MTYVLALDQGTTSCRAILFDRRSTMAAVAQREFKQYFPKPGWVEHDAEEIWQTQHQVAAEVLESAGATASDLSAVGITNQRETTVLWDRATGEPVAPAIVWQDRRTAEHCDRLRADGHEALFRERTGLALDAYFSGTKLAWLLEHVKGARERAEAGQLAFGTIDSWLAYRLTGGGLHVTDASNASRTLLYNIHTGSWDRELLEVLDIPESLLPEVRASSEVYGEITEPKALVGAPLAGLVGDQQGALFGQVCTKPGLAKNTYGTGCFLLLNTGDKPIESDNRLLTTVAWRRDSTTTYALEGAIFIAGALVQWLRDGLGIIEDAAEIEPMAASVKDNGGVVFVPALTGLGAPHWDPYARGAVFGITRGTTRGHIARAALEGIALQVADLVSAMERDSGSALAELRVDGGAARNDLLLQTQADLLQKSVVRPKTLESTALGAAYLAGLATGFWDSVDELESHWEVDRRFEPRRSERWAAALRERWEDAINRAAGWERPDGADE